MTTTAPEPITVTAPLHADGTRYRFEILHAGFTCRDYADTYTDLVDILIPGYLDMDERTRWEARLAYLTRAQVVAQACLNTADAFHTLTDTQQQVLQGPRHVPPVVAIWDAPIPLILIATYYAPAGKAPRPARDQGMEPNVIWVDPSDDTTFIESLHDIGLVSLHEAN